MRCSGDRNSGVGRDGMGGRIGDAGLKIDGDMIGGHASSRWSDGVQRVKDERRRRRHGSGNHAIRRGRMRDGDRVQTEARRRRPGHRLQMSVRGRYRRVWRGRWQRRRRTDDLRQMRGWWRRRRRKAHGRWKRRWCGIGRRKSRRRYRRCYGGCIGS